MHAMRVDVLMSFGTDDVLAGRSSEIGNKINSLNKIKCKREMQTVDFNSPAQADPGECRYIPDATVQ
jgi:hypothetical protein